MSADAWRENVERIEEELQPGIGLMALRALTAQMEEMEAALHAQVTQTLCANEGWTNQKALVEELERERDHYRFHFDQQEARAEAAEARVEVEVELRKAAYRRIERLERIEEAARAAWKNDADFYKLVAILASDEAGSA